MIAFMASALFSPWLMFADANALVNWSRHYKIKEDFLLLNAEMNL
jgi:hypothetical protein